MSQEWSIQPQAPAQPTRGRGLIWTGVVLLVVSVVVGIVGVVGIGRGVGTLAGDLTAPWSTPGAVTTTLESGRGYAIYELTGAGALATVQAADVSVVGDGGFSVPVTGMAITSQTLVAEGETYTAVAEFTAPTTGQYTIQVTAEGATVAVGPGIGAIVGVGLWGIAILVAALLGLLGLILLVVGLVLRSSSRRAAAAPGYAATSAQAYRAIPVDDQSGGLLPPQAQQAAAAPQQPPQPAPATPVQPPPGWYPDPSRPGGQRYWDGARWTEHQA